MLRTLILSAAAAATVVGTAPALATAAAAATECAQHIQAIERRMHSAGASQVSGQAPDPKSTAPRPNEEGKAPPPVASEQSASPEKMQKAESLLAKAKDQDKAGDKQGCEQTMQEVQANMGALP